MDEEDDNPCTSGFFSRRAEFIPKKSSEELQAAAELVAKIEKENSEISNVEKEVLLKKKSKKKGIKKGLVSKDRESISDDSSFSEVVLSAASKRKLKKKREEHELEMQRIEQENEKILAAMDENSNCSVEAIEETEDFEKIAFLTIMYMSKVSRLKCYENDKFLDIFPKVAELFDLKVTEFLLCLEATNISVDDTPKSLKLTDKDVLECIPYKAKENSKSEADGSGNTFQIFFQSNDSKQKVELLVHRMEKMQDIMNRYSEQRDIPLDQLIFDFDGERLVGDETPVQLDMESESCIDVTVLASIAKTPSRKTPKKRRKKRWFF